jgi:hypothetical protein
MQDLGLYGVLELPGSGKAPKIKQGKCSLVGILAPPNRA